MTLPSRDPIICDNCQTVAFCYRCINEWLKAKKNCPNCLTTKNSFSRLNEDISIKALISKVTLHCKYKEHGCNKAIKWFDYENHKCGKCGKCGESVIIEEEI